MQRINLMLHCGASAVAKEEVEVVPTPEPVDRWHPVPHWQLLTQVERSLTVSGEFRIVREAHGLTADGARYFGLLQVASEAQDEDYSTVVGLRNSHDKSVSAGLVLGAGVFVCDNLAFSGEYKLARKHTKQITRDLPGLVARAIAGLGDIRRSQAERYSWYRNQEFGAGKANDILVKAVEAGVFGWAGIGKVLGEYRRPRHPEFSHAAPGWRLYNAFTETLKRIGRDGSVWDLPRRTQALHGVFDVELGLVSRPAGAIELAG